MPVLTRTLPAAPITAQTNADGVFEAASGDSNAVSAATGGVSIPGFTGTATGSSNAAATGATEAALGVSDIDVTNESANAPAGGGGAGSTTQTLAFGDPAWLVTANGAQVNGVAVSKVTLTGALTFAHLGDGQTTGPFANFQNVSLFSIAIRGASPGGGAINLDPTLTAGQQGAAAGVTASGNIVGIPTRSWMINPDNFSYTAYFQFYRRRRGDNRRELQPLRLGERGRWCDADRTAVTRPPLGSLRFR